MKIKACARGALCMAALLGHPAQAFEAVQLGQLSIKPSFKSIFALQYGEGINYGLGAIDSPGETERSVVYLVAKPKVDLSLPLPSQTLLGESSLYGALSVVAATTQLDGELSGQVARAGDWAVSTDHAYLGWKNEVLDLSVGGQEFSVGDGFIIGDGNYNKGGENGQYWSGGFLSWRNTAILKVNTKPLRADLFWLRTDTDFKDARVAGINIETTTADTFGTLGAMYLEILQGGAFNYDGIRYGTCAAPASRCPMCRRSSSTVNGYWSAGATNKAAARPMTRSPGMPKANSPCLACRG